MRLYKTSEGKGPINVQYLMSDLLEETRNSSSLASKALNYRATSTEGLGSSSKEPKKDQRSKKDWKSKKEHQGDKDPKKSEDSNSKGPKKPQKKGKYPKGSKKPISLGDAASFIIGCYNLALGYIEELGSDSLETDSDEDIEEVHQTSYKSMGSKESKD